MTEEEKKVIEFFEKRQKYMGDYRGPLEENTDIVLNLIDKKQKEIEELNNKYNFEKVAKEEVEELLDDSIPKEKIRKKIKEIEDCLKEDCIALHEFQRLAKIDVLKELLGE